ncbi:MULTISPECIES: PCYCGC motif-containing (lipo)protein [Sediminibacillus]|uniref:PCYCGC motif-containing (lipo)protein n=1 Tax=Sediminibacillus TaxID=482460 RepID=UPI0004247936|nr:PCYCGC motif-containing (lipo)protein [Sediminibacillus terrae]
MKKLSIYVFTMLIAMLALVACSSQKAEEELAPNQELTAGITHLPQFLENASEDLQKVYQSAAEHQELLEQIPCYCGCGDASVGHQDNYDCFVHEVKDDGRVVWDTHGIGCQVCIDTAVYSISEYRKGTDISAIRKAIDNTYQDLDYPEPTPTPDV